MSESLNLNPPRPEDVQALEDLRREAIDSGTFDEQRDAFVDQANSIGVDPQSGLDNDGSLKQGISREPYVGQSITEGATLKSVSNTTDHYNAAQESWSGANPDEPIPIGASAALAQETQALDIVHPIEELKDTEQVNGKVSEATQTPDGTTDSGFDPSEGLTYKEYLEQGGQNGADLRRRVREENAQTPDSVNNSGFDHSEDDASMTETSSATQESETKDMLSNEDSTKSGSEQPSGSPKDAVPESSLKDSSPDEDLYDEYSKAVRDESVTFRVRDEETGKLVPKKAKDLNFREWITAVEKRKAAKWRLETRAHGEAPDELDIDNPSEDDISRTMDKDHQERLNAQEGKANPTEDDKDYYRWLKGHDDDEGSDIVTVPPTQLPGPPSKSPEEGGEIDFYDPELLQVEQQLEIARENYAKIREGRESATFFSIRSSKKKLKAAQEEYERTKGVAEAFAIRHLQAQGFSPESIQSAAGFGKCVEQHKLTEAQLNSEIERIGNQSPAKRKFLNWYANQKGFSGWVKKGAVLAVFAAPIGLAAGTIGAPIAGAGVAGLAALGAVRGVTRRIVGDRVDRGATAMDRATAKAHDRLREIDELTDLMEAQNDVIRTEMIDKYNENITRAVKEGNDKEAMRAIAISAAISAIAGVTIGSFVQGRWPFGGRGGGGSPGPTPTSTGLTVDQLNRGLFDGVVTSGPNAHENFVALLEYARQQGIPPGAINKGIEAAILNNVQDMPTPQGTTVANIIGGLVAPDGGAVPHEWLLGSGAIDSISSMIKGGMSAEEVSKAIIEAYANSK